MSTPSELLDQFRSDVADQAEPYLWTDDEFFTYLDDAQKQFARLTDGLPDTSTVDVTEIPVTTLTDTYALSPLILKVRAAWLLDTGRPIAVMNVEDMSPRGMYFDGRPGHVSAVITGLDTNKVRVWPFPAAALTVKLSVFRLPLATITSNSTSLEVAPQHHLNLLSWTKHRAYSKQDAETVDKTRAAEWRTVFEMYCGQAKAEQARARHKPRAVAYGGI